MNLDDLKHKRIKDSEVENAAKAIKNGRSETEILRQLQDLDSRESVVVKFELTRWVLIPVVVVVMYYLINNVFESGTFLHQAAGYILGVGILGFVVLGYIINSNKVSVAEHKANIATMIAVFESRYK